MTGQTGRDVAAGTAPAADLPRRYFAPRYLGILWIVIAVVFAAQGLLFHKWFEYTFAGWWVLLAAQVWLVPGTVVDAHGYRTWHRLRRRTVAWGDVAEIVDFGPGLAPLRVKVRLTDGQQRNLQYVGGMEVPDLRALLMQSRWTAAPTVPPGGPPSPPTP